MRKKWLVYAGEELICGIMVDKRKLIIGGMVRNKIAIENIILNYFGLDDVDVNKIDWNRIRYCFVPKKVKNVLQELSQNFTVIETRSFWRILR